jgi:hypothetical protein
MSVPIHIRAVFDPHYNKFLVTFNVQDGKRIRERMTFEEFESWVLRFGDPFVLDGVTIRGLLPAQVAQIREYLELVLASYKSTLKK